MNDVLYAFFVYHSLTDRPQGARNFSLQSVIWLRFHADYDHAIPCVGHRGDIFGELKALSVIIQEVRLLLEVKPFGFRLAD